eukprot:gene190-biopygen211
MTGETSLEHDPEQTVKCSRGLQCSRRHSVTHNFNEENLFTTVTSSARASRTRVGAGREYVADSDLTSITSHREHPQATKLQRPEIKMAR